MRFCPLTYSRILVVLLCVGWMGSILGTAVAGLKTTVAQKRHMTGRLIALGGAVGVILEPAL